MSRRRRKRKRKKKIREMRIKKSVMRISQNFLLTNLRIDAHLISLNVKRLNSTYSKIRKSTRYTT
jgi:hypothetical protein